MEHRKLNDNLGGAKKPRLCLSNIKQGIPNSSFRITMSTGVIPYNYATFPTDRIEEPQNNDYIEWSKAQGKRTNFQHIPSCM